MCIKKFFVVFFFLHFVYVFADDEIVKRLEEATELKLKKNEEEDAMEIYEEILEKYDVSLLNPATLLEIRRELAYYYFSKEEYPKAQKFFNLLVSNRAAEGDDFQDMVYKLCSSIYFQLPSCADVDLGKCFELRDTVKTYSRYVKDEKILRQINKMCNEALSLVDEQKCLYAEYYFENRYYDSALLLCDLYLRSVHDESFCKRLLLLKLKILTALNDFRSFCSFYKFFKKIKDQYSDIYRRNRSEFDELYSTFNEIWERRRNGQKTKK